MVTHLKRKSLLMQFLLISTIICGLYLLISWISYSPLDNAWSVSGNITSTTLNKLGIIGAWGADLLFSTFGQIAIFIPLALILSPLYWLLTSVGESVNYNYLFIKLFTFSLFIIGLAMMFSILFGYSDDYASGGFIGGIFTAFISSYISTIGAIIIAVILTIIGFYFCFGQSIFDLLTRFYSWVMATEEQKQAVALEKKLAKQQKLAQQETEKKQLEAMLKEEQTNEAEEQKLTDVTQFSPVRPKIIRGEQKREQEKEVNPFSHIKQPVFEPHTPQQSDELETADEPDAPLKVNTQQFIDPAELLSRASLQQATGFSSPFDNEDLPQVHLDDDIPAITPATTILDERETLLGTQLTVKQPEVKQSEPLQSKETKPVYPKGYGNTLVHPLLQQHTKMAKPKTPLPTLNLMEKPPKEHKIITDKEITEISERIEKALADFGVKATVEDVLVGPVVTRYEIQLAPGVKSSKVINIGSDLARALMFKAIRITEVPGKPYLGIETPNSHRETVWLRDIISSNEFLNSQKKLPMALGKNISGQPVVVDMAKMPHLLVAGQTGAGKSVGVNTMILSLLYKLTPEQVRFIMIDPKVVELSIYDNIPHLLTPVVTDMKKAANALRWVVDEMERRYMLLQHLNVRNIEGYNNKIKQAEEMKFPIPDPTWKPGDSMDLLPPPLEHLSYIVVIIDEFSDLIMTQGKQVEEYIIRIGQKARAAGIHLILATQRPSADVITGLIKSNIPSRIAFTVASQIDSRTILDKGGAESLLGRGDMLYSEAGKSIIRVHGAFMTDKDVEQVTNDWRARSRPNYIDAIVRSDESEGQSTSSSDGSDLDPLFDEVVAFVIDSGVTSASGVQRKFSIGFPRAARILDQLEEQGVLSTQDNRGKREILAK